MDTALKKVIQTDCMCQENLKDDLLYANESLDQKKAQQLVCT